MNCPKCGAQNMEGVTFCGNCGAQIVSHIPQSPETPQQNVSETGMDSQPTQQSQQYQQQQSYQQQPYGGPSNGGLVPPKNYMVESIVVTVVSFLCCCSPISIILGIIAIVKANNVNPEFERGNLNEAISNADSAKKLTIWAAVIAVVFYLIIMIAYFLFFAAAIAESGGWDSFFDSL